MQVLLGYVDVTMFGGFPVIEARQTPSAIQDFTQTFVLSSTPKSTQALLEVPKALAPDITRQRQAHKKSRKGCESCRRRRVKVPLP